MRVTQQQQCYAAEEVLDRSSTFASVEEMQRWVDDLRDTPCWHLQGYSLAVLRIEVGALRKNAKDRGVAHWDPTRNAGRIEVSPDGMCVATGLHEVAHVLADATLASTGHDPAWARIFLTLVSCVMGPDEYLKLQRSFDAHGVCYDVAQPVAGRGGIAL